MQEALLLLDSFLSDVRAQTRTVFFVNAHTLNIACKLPYYRYVLQNADYVFGDGTGVRWAARFLHGARLRDNVNGTDLVPKLFAHAAERQYRYYLLGTKSESIDRAADHALETFPGWQLSGYHHGYLGADDGPQLVDEINAAKPHMLLVGMGNPIQEIWLHEHKAQLRVPLCMGVGGLFSYWSGELDRAPTWIRRIGFEWLYLLARQPTKFRRYVLGNPQFLLRIAREKWLRCT